MLRNLKAHKIATSLTTTFFMLAATAFMIASSNATSAAEDYIRLANTLDEPRGYCLDIPGRPSSPTLEKGMQLHTCKTGDGISDVMFSVNSRTGQIHNALTDLCVEAGSAKAGQALYMKPCTSTATQQFNFETNGRLSLKAGNKLCVSTTAEAGVLLGNGIFHARPLKLVNCDQVDSTLATWNTPRGN